MNAVLLLIAISLSVSGQMLLKLGVIATPPTPQFQSILSTLLSWRIILGLALYAISTIFWLFILKRLPLSIAYPTLSISYVLIVLLSIFFFGESLTITKTLGVGAIVLGVCLLYFKL